MKRKRKQGSRSKFLGCRMPTALAHEIRNPLTALSALAQLLPGRMNDKVFLNSFHKLMTHEIGRLMRLTDISPSAAGQYGEESGEVNLTPILERTLQLLGPLFSGKRIKPKFEAAPSLYLRGEEDQLECLALNLLKNAVESVEPGGKIEVLGAVGPVPGHRKGPWIQLRVWDNGPGIGKKDLRRIFKPHFSTKGEGMGLGLSICQEIVEKHGGSLRVSSSSAKGTEFLALFPGRKKP